MADIGWAIEQAKKGERVYRTGWNGKGIWITVSGVGGPRDVRAKDFWSATNQLYAENNGGAATALPCLTMKTSTGEILMGWNASTGDLLADDWQLA